MKANLKPCPFCGETAEMDAHQSYRSMNGRMLTRISIYCTRCPANISESPADLPDITENQVVEMWNQRIVP